MHRPETLTWKFASFSRGPAKDPDGQFDTQALLDSFLAGAGLTAKARVQIDEIDGVGTDSPHFYAITLKDPGSMQAVLNAFAGATGDIKSGRTPRYAASVTGAQETPQSPQLE
ncbi:MAG: hypothetical protein M3O22_03740 [Pseudomonadota bacterium]|nr:hypothetical protein [Pseudomonadota bacterium]